MPLQDPKSLIPDLVEKRGYTLYPPLGPIYIKSIIETNTDWKVDIVDLQLEMLKNQKEINSFKNLST